MILHEERNCPYCDSYIGECTEVFMRDDEIIGCEHCMWSETVHIETDEEMREAYEENLADDMRISEVLGI